MKYSKFYYNSTIYDERVQKLIEEMGIRGYGIYWYIVELLNESNVGMSIKLIPDICNLIDEDITDVTRVIYGFNLFTVIHRKFFVINKNPDGRFDFETVKNYN